MRKEVIVIRAIITGARAVTADEESIVRLLGELLELEGYVIQPWIRKLLLVKGSWLEVMLIQLFKGLLH